MISNLLYWQAVAKGIDAENEKASLFIRHGPSLGVMREAILSDLICKQTVEPFRVHTGFVCNATTSELIPSRQCDILVYNPAVMRPYFENSFFSVVDHSAVRFVAEVKSDLDAKEFESMCEVASSVRRFSGIPLFGFAFNGCVFSTLLDKVADQVKSDLTKVPTCIVVHRQNYVICGSDSSPNNFTAYDFSKVSQGSGLATAFLLSLCGAILRYGKYGCGDHARELFNELGKTDAAVNQMTITDEGEIRQSSFR